MHGVSRYRWWTVILEPDTAKLGPLTVWSYVWDGRHIGASLCGRWLLFDTGICR